MKKICIYFILLLILTSISCKKNSTSSNPEITPIKTLESQLAYKRIKSDPLITNARELGFVFDANVDGKITKVGGKALVATTYRITIWDFTTGAILSTSNVNLDSTAYKYQSITPVPITMNKRYVISANYTGLCFSLLDPTLGPSMFPNYANGITIYNTTLINSSAQTFGNCCGELDQIVGLTDFVFVAN